MNNQASPPSTFSVDFPFWFENSLEVIILSPKTHHRVRQAEKLCPYSKYIVNQVFAILSYLTYMDNIPWICMKYFLLFS